MEEIYKNVLLLVHSLTQLSGITYMFKEDPTEANGDKIIEVVNKCENKFLKVKEEIVKMLHEVDDNEIAEGIEVVEEIELEEIQEIKAVQTDNGFLIKE